MDIGSISYLYPTFGPPAKQLMLELTQAALELMLFLNNMDLWSPTYANRPLSSTERNHVRIV